MTNLLKTWARKIHDGYNRATVLQEDAPVLAFLNSLPAGKYEYLEAGSGLGRFPLLLKERMPHLSLTCQEINESLASRTSTHGIKTVNRDLLQTDLATEAYDIVHCSHVIEHFGYPQITRLLDNLLASLKKGGYLIIRSPLLYPGFYNDIDHVRPYPPEAILNYLGNPQQQKLSSHKAVEVSRWYRRASIQINTGKGSRLLYAFNLLLKVSWMLSGLPRSNRTGYVLILQKKSS